MIFNRFWDPDELQATSIGLGQTHSVLFANIKFKVNTARLRSCDSDLTEESTVDKTLT
jgi:hypothetical protein